MVKEWTKQTLSQNPFPDYFLDWTPFNLAAVFMNCTISESPD